MINPPPVVVQKKRGMGCFGWGCLIVVILALLVAALAAGTGYFLRSAGAKLTSAQATAIPTFDGGDEVYQATQQKLTAFNQALQANQPAKLELSADEINTLLARDPDLTSNHISLFVTLTDNEARVQASLPTSMLPFGLLQGRYINLDAVFTPDFETESKSLNVTLHRLRLGNSDVPQDSLMSLQSVINSSLNTQLQAAPGAKQWFDHAKSIEIRGGKLEVETQ